MADKKITDLPALTTATPGDLLPIVDDSGSVTKKVTVDGLIATGSITTAKLADGAVTNAKVTTGVATSKLSNPYKFSVYRAAALNSTSTFAVIPFDTKVVDTSTNVDVVTNKGRFTAPVAGYYFFCGAAGNTTATSTQMGVQLLKNGLAYQNGTILNTSLNSGSAYPYSGWLPLAANDYIELAFIGGNGSTMLIGSANCWFSGFLMSST